jgi:hypothetical protein
VADGTLGWFRAGVPAAIGRCRLHRARGTDRAADQGAPQHDDRVGVSPVLISGPPGAGKTALPLQAAHRLKPSFPDGQLSPDRPPDHWHRYCNRSRTTPSTGRLPTISECLLHGANVAQRETPRRPALSFRQPAV